MLKNILTLERVTILNKKQQQNVRGGGGYCRLTIIYSNGGREPGGGYFLGDTGQDISNAASNFCSQTVQSEPGVSRCFYDCEHDGFGQ
ncbi:hypothetical protein [Kordia jejudonensis]|uniref:hypothetical protein n=1 Tax=Kordia jejudonensis TaxID=1348245 RepID=UPI0006291848|nr:hypothetical protein [Kordia jejudonensis]